jgi:hypothetical protein
MAKKKGVCLFARSLFARKPIGCDDSVFTK